MIMRPALHPMHSTAPCSTMGDLAVVDLLAVASAADFIAVDSVVVAFPEGFIADPSATVAKRLHRSAAPQTMLATRRCSCDAADLDCAYRKAKQVPFRLNLAS